MLKKIPKNLSPELVKVLMEMGHGDEIVIADGNYPSASHARNLIRQDGLTIPELLQSILVLFPLDTYVDQAITLIDIVPGDRIQPIIWENYTKIIANSQAENSQVEYLKRFSFYERGKKAYAIVATGEEALYANIMLRKGVVK